MFGVIINLLLDPIFIFGLWKIPKLGIKGAAIASIIGETVGLIIGFIFIIKLKIINFIEFFKPNIDRRIIKDILKVGFPIIVLESVSAFITIILNKILSNYSIDAISVWGIYGQLQKFVLIIVYGFNYGMIPILAYNWGAKNEDRVKDIIKIFIKISIIVTFIGQLIFLCFTKQIIQIFNVSNDLMNIAIPAFRILSLGFVFAGISLVISSMFQAFGNGINSLIINLSRQIVFSLPFILLFKYFIGMDGIWIAFVLAEIITVLIAIFLYNKNKNKIFYKNI